MEHTYNEFCWSGTGQQLHLSSNSMNKSINPTFTESSSNAATVYIKIPQEEKSGVTGEHNMNYEIQWRLDRCNILDGDIGLLNGHKFHAKTQREDELIQKQIDDLRADKAKLLKEVRILVRNSNVSGSEFKKMLEKNMNLVKKTPAGDRNREIEKKAEERLIKRRKQEKVKIANRLQVVTPQKSFTEIKAPFPLGTYTAFITGLSALITLPGLWLIGMPTTSFPFVSGLLGFVIASALIFDWVNVKAYKNQVKITCLNRIYRLQDAIADKVWNWQVEDDDDDSVMVLDSYTATGQLAVNCHEFKDKMYCPYSASEQYTVIGGNWVDDKYLRITDKDHLGFLCPCCKH